jgi:hypothetical protein
VHHFLRCFEKPKSSQACHYLQFSYVKIIKLDLGLLIENIDFFGFATESLSLSLCRIFFDFDLIASDS